MQQLSAEALRGAVLGRIGSDPAFLEALRTNPTAAIESRFGKQAHAVRVIFEDASEISVMLPQKSEQLAKVLARVVADIGDRTPSKGQFDALTIHKAWTDPVYLAELKKEPRATIAAALKAYGSELPADTRVVLREEQSGECLIVVPTTLSGQLSDAELESVAGGELAVTGLGIVASVAVVVGVEVVAGVAVTVAAEWFCKAQSIQ